MESVGLLFVGATDPVSKVIRWRTGSPWSHVALLDDTGGNLIEAWATKGVRARAPLVPKASDAVELVRIYSPSAVDVWLNAVSQLGKPYDWMAVIGLGLGQSWNSNEKWFCSELAAWSLEAAGIHTVFERVSRVTPGMLYEAVHSHRFRNNSLIASIQVSKIK